MFVVVVFQVSLVLVFMVGVIVYKLLVYRPLASNASTRARAQQIANVTGAFVNLTIIMILSRVGTTSSGFPDMGLHMCVSSMYVKLYKVLFLFKNMFPLGIKRVNPKPGICFNL